MHARRVGSTCHLFALQMIFLNNLRPNFEANPFWWFFRKTTFCALERPRSKYSVWERKYLINVGIEPRRCFGYILFMHIRHRFQTSWRNWFHHSHIHNKFSPQSRVIIVYNLSTQRRPSPRTFECSGRNFNTAHVRVVLNLTEQEK